MLSTLWTVITSKLMRSKLSFAGNLRGKVNKLEWLWRQELTDVYTDNAKTFYRNFTFVTWARLFSPTFFFNILYNHYVAPGKNVGAERILLAICQEADWILVFALCRPVLPSLAVVSDRGSSLCKRKTNWCMLHFLWISVFPVLG